MKKFLAFFSAIIFLSVTFLSCADGMKGSMEEGTSGFFSNNSSSGFKFSHPNVTGYDDIDWDDLNDSTYGDWMTGTWDYKLRRVIDDKLETVTGVFDIQGIEDTSSVIFSESSDTSLVPNSTMVFSQLKEQMKFAYGEDSIDAALAEIKSQIESLYAGASMTYKDKNLYMKVNPQRNKMEFYKSVYIIASFEGESKVLVIQVNESLVKRK